jgi:cAMP-dependent protein kinase regulator
VCAQLASEAGADHSALLADIARAFGAGSSRIGDAPALPPPIPSPVKLSPAGGVALQEAAERALARFIAVPDSLPEDTRLPCLPLFGALAPPVLSKLLAVLVLREYSAGHAVVRQSEDGCEAFLLVRGTLNVVREEPATHATLLAVLRPPALFGEMALVSRAPRAASVVTIDPAQVLMATRTQIELLAQSDPTIGRELGRFCQRRMLTNLLRHSPILSAVDPAQRPRLMARFTARSFPAGEPLLREGEEGGRLFVIASGLVEVRRTDADGDAVVVVQLGPGEVVGEISLVLRQPATADVVALHNTVALELQWSEFHEAIREYPGLLQQLYAIATQREAETRSVVAQEAMDISDAVLL